MNQLDGSKRYTLLNLITQVHLQAPQGERKKLTPTTCPLIFSGPCGTCTLAHMCMCGDKHTKNK